MHDERTILVDLAVVLCVAGITSVLFRRLKQPVVLGYLLAGLIVGPYVPIPLVADSVRIHALSELGVTLVMFAVGLELSVRRLLRVVPAAGLTGVIQISTMIGLGYGVAQLLGWSVKESLFTGAMIAISSTMIVAKVFAEQRIDRTLTEVVFGVLVIQDLAAVLLLAMLTAIVTQSGDSGGVLAITAARLLLFLLVIVGIGFAIVPRAVRMIARQRSPETMLVASVGLCFALAVLADQVGFSVALGAFLAGSLVAESGRGKQVENLIAPLRDMFSAVFFVAVGMSVDPKLVAEHWPAVIALVVAVLVGQVVSVSLGAFLSGNGVRNSIKAGMSLAQIGELSFVIAGLGVQSGAVREFLYPIAVSVCVITSFTTPWLVRSSQPLAAFIDHRLPESLQTFVSLYGAWLEQLRSNRRSSMAPHDLTRLSRLLALDGVLFAAIIIGTSVNLNAIAALAHDRYGLEPNVARWSAILAAASLCLPFALGMARIARTLGTRLAVRALPSSATARGDAPKETLIVAFEIAALFLVGAPVVAITQPFVPPLYGVGIFFVVLALLAFALWQRASDLQEHVQAGAQSVVDALARQSGGDLPAEHTPLLAGLGPVTPVLLEAHSEAIGRTLAQVDLRARSGASVIAIRRGEAGLVQPTGREELQIGDVLALAGTHEAIDAAVAVLTAPTVRDVADD